MCCILSLNPQITSDASTSIHIPIFTEEETKVLRGHTSLQGHTGRITVWFNHQTQGRLWSAEPDIHMKEEEMKSFFSKQAGA